MVGQPGRAAFAGKDPSRATLGHIKPKHVERAATGRAARHCVKALGQAGENLCSKLTSPRQPFNNPTETHRTKRLRLCKYSHCSMNAAYQKVFTHPLSTSGFQKALFPFRSGNGMISLETKGRDAGMGEKLWNTTQSQQPGSIRWFRWAAFYFSRVCFCEKLNYDRARKRR